MKTTCGKARLRDKHFKHLAMLGEVIDRGIQPLVFDDGLVDVQRPTESEVNSYAPATRPGNGPPAGQRQRRRTRSRPPRQAKPLGSETHEKTYGVGFRVLAQHYEALSFEDENGLWVVARAHPLGTGGPQANFLIALPLDQRVAPRAWGFTSLGKRSTAYPLKHTNFPDASICAFTEESEAWRYEDGILALVDHYSLWAAKSLHKSHLGWWPGPQIGVGSLYRRNEFTGREFCGCESGKLYRNCHQPLDLMMDEDRAHSEFRRLFRCDYGVRAVPRGVLTAAQSYWKAMPNMAAIFSVRPNPTEPVLSLVA